MLGPPLVLWELAVRSHFWSPAAVASPLEILICLPLFFSPGAYGDDVLLTLTRSFFSITLGAAIGMLLGYTVSLVSFGRTTAIVLVDALRSIPGTALVPLFLIIFGPEEMSKVGIGVFGCSLTMAIAIIASHKTINTERGLVADTLGLKSIQRVTKYDMPETLPGLFIGLRSGASLALVLVIVSEMIGGGNGGLGRVISDSRHGGGIPDLYAAIVLSGGLGVLFNKLIGILERHKLHWVSASR